MTADQWRSSQYLSILADAGKLMEPARSETMPCEYLSLDVMQRWVVLGFLLIHQQVRANSCTVFFVFGKFTTSLIKELE
mgnify:FL=1